MKSTLTIFVLFILLLQNASGQTYRHINDSPFQIILSDEYHFDGSFFTKTNYKEHIKLSVNCKNVFLKDTNIKSIDTLNFQEITYYYKKDDIKVIKFDKLTINNYQATYIETQDSWGEINLMLYIIQNKTVYILTASVMQAMNTGYYTDDVEKLNFEKSNDFTELKNNILNANFKPNELPDAFKDFMFDMDTTILKYFICDKISKYPNLKFTKEKYQSLDISFYYIETKPDKREEFAKNKSYTFLKEYETEVKNYIIDGHTAIEVIHKDKNSAKNGIEYNYNIVIFDPNSKYYVIIKYDFKDKTNETLNVLRKFNSSLKRKL